ncbi:MAG: hypothetical protein MUO50_09280, partial [Longimicrobiales bacterium]|nr:hypothetical protein [Longimicrobiales bacterium]
EGATKINIDALTARLDRADHAWVRQSLSDVGYSSALELLSTYAGRAGDLESWLEGSEINRDRNLRLMYLAGLQLNKYQQSSIYAEILGRSRFPADVFVGSPQSIIILRMLLGLG